MATGVEIGEIFSDWILEQADVDLDGLAIAGLASPGLMLILALVMLLAQLPVSRTPSPGSTSAATSWCRRTSPTLMTTERDST